MTLHTLAYLNRPTVDGRTLGYLRVDADRDLPLPIIRNGELAGRIDRVVIEDDVVWVEPDWGTADEPDWSLWCLTADVKATEVHHISRAAIRIDGTLAGATLSRVDDWPWSS